MVILRPLTSNDLHFLLEVRNDPSTRHFLEDNNEFTLSECNKWFNEKKPIWFIIEVNKTSVGYVRTKEDEIGVDNDKQILVGSKEFIPVCRKCYIR